MSIKSFLKTKEMQTGGMLSLNSLDTGASFVSPFARSESPRSTFPSAVERAPLPILKKETPPTIKLEDPIDMDPGSFDPSNSGTLSIHHPSVIAGAAALGYTLTGAEDQFTLMDIMANAPGNAFTDFLDAGLMFAGKGILTAATGGLAAPIIAGVDQLTKGSIFGDSKNLGSKALAAVEYALGNINQTASAQPAVPTAAQSIPTAAALGIENLSTAPTASITPAEAVQSAIVPGTQGSAYFTPAGETVYFTDSAALGGPVAPVAPVAPTPDSARQAIAAINRTPASAAPAAPTAAAVGTGMFGNIYGMGGEISPSFAIGGKGSFTSFAHYGAGVSQADEINLGQAGMANGSSGFETPEAGKLTIDTLVDKGYNESAITAVATGMGTEGKPDFDAGFSDPGKVICQELYDQGLLEHSIYSLDEQFGEQLRKHDTDLLEGYHTWAYDVVDAMRKSKIITHIVRIVSRPVVKHIAYKMGYPSKTILGAAMFNVGAFVCRRLAKKETVYA